MQAEINPTLMGGRKINIETSYGASGFIWLEIFNAGDSGEKSSIALTPNEALQLSNHLKEQARSLIVTINTESARAAFEAAGLDAKAVDAALAGLASGNGN